MNYNQSAGDVQQVMNEFMGASRSFEKDSAGLAFKRQSMLQMAMSCATCLRKLKDEVTAMKSYSSGDGCEIEAEDVTSSFMNLSIHLKACQITSRGGQKGRPKKQEISLSKVASELNQMVEKRGGLEGACSMARSEKQLEDLLRNSYSDIILK